MKTNGNLLSQIVVNQDYKIFGLWRSCDTYAPLSSKTRIDMAINQSG